MIATINVTPEVITLRIRVPDYGVVHVMEGRQQFKLTTSSPGLLTALKTRGSVYRAYSALRGIETANLSQETSIMKMERFRALAEQSSSLIEFVCNAGLGIAPAGGA